MSEKHRPSSHEKMEVKRKQGFTCAITGEVYKPRDLVVHHIVPLAQGGSNDPENLAAIHPSWHREIDRLAFEESIYLTDIFMREQVGETVVFQRNPNIDYGKFIKGLE